MGFVGIYRASYDYAPQAEGELPFSEDDILFVLEKGTDDDWWKAKKKAAAEDEDEPTGLVPNNYIEEANPIGSARALYEYTRQTEEELSFPEDAVLRVFDTSDPDWILVGLDDDYGFVPANYIEMMEPELGNSHPSAALPPPALPARPPVDDVAGSPDSLQHGSPSSQPPAPAALPAISSGPAAALAAALASGATPKPSVSFSDKPPTTIHSPPALSNRDFSSPEPHEAPTGEQEQAREEPSSPPLPSRPVPRLEPRDAPGRTKSPPIPIRATSRRDFDSVNATPLSPGGFRLYHINEMVSLMGKRKKMPTTLGINLATGVIMIAPEHSQDGPTQEWTGDRMTHYSREGKHVFLELVKPSKSIDFHAGSKDTAEEIVGALGELAGAIRAEGLLEVMSVGRDRGQRKGVVLYDFNAQGEDEVSVQVGDDVLILDDRLSEEWWKVRRLRTDKEGVVPSSYIEVTEAATSPGPGANSGRTTVEQNRLEEKRLAREALKGSAVPDRGTERSQRSASSSSQPAKSKPDPSKIRTWTDRSKSFSVEAQFLGLKDGKINLHKVNGVKIAVPLAKMSVEDLDFVERITGQTIQHKPGRERGEKRATLKSSADSSSHDKIGATVEPRKPDYDWFQFFLSCDVAVGLCDRYAQAFVKDSIDESVLPDVDANVLRNLGLREGDIIKVMRFLDNKFNRARARKDGEGEGGGLFAGEGGKLKNNTRKGRPAPATQAGDVVDAKAFSREQQGASSNADPETRALSGAENSVRAGFDDDAWDVKPARVQAVAAVARQSSPKPKEPEPAATRGGTTSQHPAQSAAILQPHMTAGMQELSLLSQPLEPTRPSPTDVPSPPIPAPNPQVGQMPGASPSVFDAVASLKSSPATQAGTRPTPPSNTPTQNNLAPPPPARPLSAPQVAGPGQFGASTLMPQMTGIQGQVAPPGQSLGDLNQARLQQQALQQQDQLRQMQQQQPMPGSFMMPQPTAAMGPQMTGFQGSYSQQQHQSAGLLGPQLGASGVLQSQPTGIHGQYTVSGPVNSFLPSPLEPQRTSMQPHGPMQQSMQPVMQSTGGLGQFGAGQGQQLQPLAAQKTGPVPPIRFGISNEPKKLTPQPTARRANLAHATPDNPFGF